MARAKARTVDDIYARPGFKLRRAHQISQSIFMAECRDFDLTPRQYGMLYVLSVHPGLDQISLARLLGLDRSTTGMVLATLASRDLVFRSTDGKDRRKRVLHLTRVAAQLLDTVQPAARQARDRLLAPLTLDERALLLALLDKIIAANNEGARVPLRPRAALAASP